MLRLWRSGDVYSVISSKVINGTNNTDIEANIRDVRKMNSKALSDFSHKAIAEKSERFRVFRLMVILPLTPVSLTTIT